MDAARFSRAIQLRDTGHCARARSEFESILKTVESADEFVAVVLGIIGCDLRESNYVSARLRVETALQRRNEVGREVRLFLDYTLGCLESLTSNFERSVEIFSGLEKDYPDLIQASDWSWLEPELNERLGIASIEVGLFAVGLARLERVAEMPERDSGNAYYYIAKARWARADFAGAIQASRMALSTTELRVRARAEYQLGVWLFQMGEFQEALQRLEHAASFSAETLGLSTEAIERDLGLARSKASSRLT